MTINQNIIGNTCNVVDKILITCPHDGRRRPDKVEERDKCNLPSGCNEAQFNTGNDSYTRTLSRKIAMRMHKICSKSPSLVIAEYHRKYIDMNRSRHCAYEVQQAKQFYDEYHQLISQHVEDICIKNKDSYIKGWLFDIHGRVQDPETPEEIAIGTENGKTISRLKEINQDALWDETGLIKLLQQRYTTNPTNKSERESSRYNGGYTINEHDCSFDKDGLQRIQLEIALPLRQDPKRRIFVEHLVNVILLFVSRYSTNF